MRRPFAALAAALALVSAAPAVRAQADLELVEVRVDPPTLHTLGVQVLIQGDDDHDAAISVRLRRARDREWRDGPPLFRVRPETVSEPVAAQFAGSVFDLAPGTSYEVELHAQDPDGLDETRTVEAATRSVPAAEPARSATPTSCARRSSRPSRAMSSPSRTAPMRGRSPSTQRHCRRPDRRARRPGRDPRRRQLRWLQRARGVRRRRLDCLLRSALSFSG